MKRIFILLVVSTFGQFLTVQAKASESYSSFDDIVRELQASSSSYKIQNTQTQEETILIHGAVGIISSRLNLNLPSPLPASTTLRGFEAQVGIDLFSPRWSALGSLRNFQQEEFSSGTIHLNEFDMLVVYNAPIARPVYFHIGAGMSARYLDFSGQFEQSFLRSNTTPSSVLTLGLDGKFVRALSVGAFISYRSSLVDDTVDEGSMDGTFRLSGHF